MDSLASSPTPAAASAQQSEYTRFRACGECRRRKIKCDGRVSGCRHCLTAGVPCVYNTPPRGTRKRAASHRASADPETTVNLEERLERIERAVKDHLTSRLAAQPPPAENAVTIVNPNPNLDVDTRRGKQRALYLWKVTDEGAAEKAAEADGGLLEDFHGKLKFIGESSVFALFLPRGMQWVCEKTGEPHFCDPLSRASIREWSTAPPEDVLAAVPRELTSFSGFLGGEEAPLPARHVVRKLINDYFDRLNTVVPIFSRDRFDAELAMFYQNGMHASPAWLLSFYGMLALGCISNPAEEPAAVRAASAAQALSFFRTACRNVPKVLFCNRDISGLQSLLVAVLFLWETQASEGCFTLLGIVSSLGTEIGIHRCGTHLGLPPALSDLRSNVFWAAYILDKDISLRIGRPSSISDNDITVKLPSPSTSYFYHRVKLARILSRVSRLLCSQATATLPDHALLGIISMLESELEAWRDGCEMMADESLLGTADLVTTVHLVRLRLVYYSCLSAIKRPLNPAFDLADPSAPHSFETCLDAAHATIGLIDVFERRQMKLLRSTAIYMVAAAVTLFVNILHDPLAEAVERDVNGVRRVKEYFRRAVEGGCGRVVEMFFLVFTLDSMVGQTVGRFRGGIKEMDGDSEVGDEYGGVGQGFSGVGERQRELCFGGK